MHFMQCLFISNVETLILFQDSLMNKKLNKNSIYLKYNFLTIYTTIQKLAVSMFIFFKTRKLVFIQKGFVKLIETVIVRLILLENNIFWINAVLFNFLFINEPQTSITVCNK